MRSPFSLLLGILFVFLSQGVCESSKELRGVWISDTTKFHWKDVVSQVKKARLNAIFVNVASAGVAFYPSEFLPEKKPKEPLSELIRLAHLEGITVHAKLLTFFMYWAPKKQIEAMIKENRLLKNMQGKEVLQAKTPWLDPILPENQALVLNVMTEILEKFDVDGIQLDYLRFFEEKGVPDSIMEIRRNSMSNFVSELKNTLQTKPSVRLSACVFHDLKRAKEEMGQAWDLWGDKRFFTFMVPMDYTTDLSTLNRWLGEQATLQTRTSTLYPGLGAYMKGMTPGLLEKEIQSVRRYGFHGFVLFSFTPSFVSKMVPMLEKLEKKYR